MSLYIQRSNAFNCLTPAARRAYRKAMEMQEVLKSLSLEDLKALNGMHF